MAELVHEAIRDVARRLAPVSAEAEREARLLAAFVMGRKPGELRSITEIFPGEYRQRLNELSAERLTGRPLQYVMGEWDFMGMTFRVDERALIPRQDTETLCEEALALIKARGYKTCLDMCCGSGCIGIALSKLAGVGAALADISPAALSLARENAALHGIEAKLIETNMFEGVHGSFDIIACNPPYIPRAEMGALQAELRFEPENALYGGEDGLDFYRRIAKDAPEHMNDGGALLLEVGMGEAEAVAAMFRNARISKDVLGIERVVTVLK